MNNNFEILCRHFESEGVTFTPHREDHLIEANFDFECMRVRFFARLPPGETFMTFLMVFPVAIPSARRAAVGEFLHRLNRTSHAGSFEMNYDDGEVRFVAATLPDADYLLSADRFRCWLSVVSLAVEGYGPVLMQVAFGNISPAHAAEQAEARMQEYLRRIGARQD